MRSGKKLFKRLKCENCGERLYQIQDPFKEYFWGDVPQHFPKCGVKINFDIKCQLIVHDELIWFLLCIIIITFMIVILVILGLVSEKKLIWDIINMSD